MRPWSEEWMERSWDDPVSVYRVAQIYEDEGDDPEAKECYEIAHALAEIRLLPITKEMTPDGR